MAKHEKESAPPTDTKSDPMPQTGCVVCGGYEGDLSETAGSARWHPNCGTARPDVIAKVKARA